MLQWKWSPKRPRWDHLRKFLVMLFCAEYLPLQASDSKRFLRMLQLQLLNHILEVLGELKVKRW